METRARTYVCTVFRSKMLSTAHAGMDSPTVLYSIVYIAIRACVDSRPDNPGLSNLLHRWATCNGYDGRGLMLQTTRFFFFNFLSEG